MEHENKWYKYGSHTWCYKPHPNAYRETSSHIQSLRRQFGCTRDENNDFLAISLHKADKEKFELDFHDFERKMLKERGCVKKVIMLIKYLRDIQMGSMDKIWSHLIKVISSRLFIYVSDITTKYIPDICHAPCSSNIPKLLGKLQLGGMFNGITGKPSSWFSARLHLGCFLPQGNSLSVCMTRYLKTIYRSTFLTASKRRKQKTTARIGF